MTTMNNNRLPKCVCIVQGKKGVTEMEKNIYIIRRCIIWFSYGYGWGFFYCCFFFLLRISELKHTHYNAMNHHISIRRGYRYLKKRTNNIQLLFEASLETDFEIKISTQTNIEII